MLQESVTDQEEVLVLSWESALVDHEVAFVVVRLIKILLRVDFEHVVTHLETYWLYLRGDVFAGVLNVAEGLVRGAVKVWESGSPLLPDLVKYIRWDRKLGTSSVDDSWIGGVMSWLLHWLGSIEHTLSFKSPGSEPVLEVFECLKTLSSTNNLGRVVSSKESVRSLTHIL